MIAASVHHFCLTLLSNVYWTSVGAAGPGAYAVAIETLPRVSVAIYRATGVLFTAVLSAIGALFVRIFTAIEEWRNPRRNQ